MQGASEAVFRGQKSGIAVHQKGSQTLKKGTQNGSVTKTEEVYAVSHD